MLVSKFVSVYIVLNATLALKIINVLLLEFMCFLGDLILR